MKHSKHLRLLLVAALVVLLVVALVACNDGGNKNKDNDPNKNPSENPGENPGNTPDDTPDEAQQILELAKADIEAAYNYTLAFIEENADNPECEASLYISYIPAGSRTTPMKNTSQVVMLGFDYSFGEGYNQTTIFICPDKDNAQAAYDFALKYMLGEDDNELIEIDGNKVIHNKSMYQKFQNATRPATIAKYSDEQLKFMDDRMYKPAQKGDDYIQLMIDWNSGDNDYGMVDYMKVISHSNCNISETIMAYEDFDDFDRKEYAQFQKFKSINYTDDSFFNVDEESGYVSYSLTDKPGWHVEDIYESRYNDQTHKSEEFVSGKYSATYFYDKLPDTLIVPSEVDEYEIERAVININYDDTLNEVIIEKPMERVDFWHNVKKATIPASDTTFVYFDDNAALEEITFTGTTQQWESLYENYAQLWTHIYDHYDYENDADVYVDISFTVECTNGNLTYPKTDAERLASMAKADIDAIYNYTLDLAEKNSDVAGWSVYTYFAYYSSSFRYEPMGNEKQILSIDLCYGTKDENEVVIYICLDANDAQAVYNYNAVGEVSDQYGIYGNKVIRNMALYQEIIGTARPEEITKFSADQLKFMEDRIYKPLNENEGYTATGICYDTYNDRGGEVDHEMYLTKGNCYTEEGIEKCPTNVDSRAAMEYEQIQKFKSINYTEDSFINVDDETGYVSYRLSHKPGWHVEEIYDSEYDSQTDQWNMIATGKYRASYYYDDELPTTLVVPTKIGDYEIEEVEIDISIGDTLDELVIEKPMSSVRVDGNVKEVTVPDSDKAFVHIYDNAALETIHFNGTTDKWNELYGESAQGWTKIYDHTDPQTEQDVYVYITFTVICTNGTLTYTGTNE